MNEKILGYILLSLGIVLILFSGFSLYQVFTKQTKPVELFNFSSISLNPSQFIPQLPQGSQPMELVSKDMLNQSTNVFAHLLFMGFIANLGVKLSTIGTQLVRPIVVKLKAKEVESTT